MKTIVLIASVIFILVCMAEPCKARTDLGPDIKKKLSDILTECQKLTPGMTRAQLTNDFTLDAGKFYHIPEAPTRHRYRREAFMYRGCEMIKIDVDFAVTGSTKDQPADEDRLTDVILVISKPYLDWTYDD